MKYFATKISDNLKKTPEGYLLALAVPIGRTGTMEYAHGEVPVKAGPDGIIKISRNAEELFAPETIASFEGKPLTIKHPEEWVSPKNYKKLSHGHIQNVRRGSGDLSEDLLADILITDDFAISLVESGVRGLSCGYEAQYKQTGEGTGIQRNIVGNHLALVEEGRAGETYKINDAKGAVMKKTWKEKLIEAFTKTVDEMPSEEGKSKDEEAAPSMPGMDELMKCFKDLGDKIEGLGKKSNDEEEPVPAKKKEKKEAHAEDEGNDLEERLKKLEMAVSKLLEAQSGDESEDEESDEVTDEDDSDDETEDEDQYAAVGDDAAKVEILAPGFKAKTKDAKELKVLALKEAYKTKDGKSVIDLLSGGKPNFKDESAVNILFNASAEMLSDDRDDVLAGAKKHRKTKTKDSMNGEDGAMTPDKLNELNKKHYN